MRLCLVQARPQSPTARPALPSRWGAGSGMAMAFCWCCFRVCCCCFSSLSSSSSTVPSSTRTLTACVSSADVVVLQVVPSLSDSFSTRAATSSACSTAHSVWWAEWSRRSTWLMQPWGANGQGTGILGQLVSCLATVPRPPCLTTTAFTLSPPIHPQDAQGSACWVVVCVCVCVCCVSVLEDYHWANAV